MKDSRNKLTVRDRMKIRKDIRRDCVWDELHMYGSEVIASDEMHKAFEQKHHMCSTVGEHTLRVAVSSVLICHVLRRLRINVDIPAVVVASLCHDLGMIGREEKYSSNRDCHRNHPKESVRVARRLVDNMPDKAEAIIERHMWPARGSKAPNSIEGIVVSVADKYNAVKDLVKGSEFHHTGVRYCVSNKKNRLKVYGMRQGS